MTPTTVITGYKSLTDLQKGRWYRIIGHTDWLVLFRDANHHSQLTGSLRSNKPFMFLRLCEKLTNRRQWVFLGVDDIFGFGNFDLAMTFEEVIDHELHDNRR